MRNFLLTHIYTQNIHKAVPKYLKYNYQFLKGPKSTAKIRFGLRILSTY